MSSYPIYVLLADFATKTNPFLNIIECRESLKTLEHMAGMVNIGLTFIGLLSIMRVLLST